MKLDEDFNELYNNMKDEMFFECSFQRDDKLKIKLKKLCGCKCCPRHMSCRPEYDMIKIIIDNKDKDEIEVIKEHVKNDIILMGSESVKYNFINVFSNLIDYVSNKNEIAENDDIIKNHVQHLINLFYTVMTTFNDIKHVTVLCNIFEYKLMTMIMNKDFLSIDDKNEKVKIMEELMHWSLHLYDDLKKMFYFQVNNIEIFTKGELDDIKNENFCRCNCRSFLRNLLIKYFDEEK